MGKEKCSANGKGKEQCKWERKGIVRMGKERKMRMGKERNSEKWERNGQVMGKRGKEKRREEK